MKKHGGFFEAVVVFSTLFFFFAAEAYSSQAPLVIAGQVRGEGDARMKTFSGHWIGVSDKTYPVASGSVLRTGKGKMTITTRNGARIEVGGHSEVSIGAAAGSCTVDVLRGSIAYDVPRSARLSINTANSKMTADPYSKGFVGRGEKTYIRSAAGSLAVYDPNGRNLIFMRTGQTVMVSHEGGRYLATPSAFGEAEIEAAVTKNPAPSSGSGAGSTILLVAGGAAAAGGIGVALGSSGGGGGGGSSQQQSVSPSQP